MPRFEPVPDSYKDLEGKVVVLTGKPDRERRCPLPVTVDEL